MINIFQFNDDDDDPVKTVAQSFILQIHVISDDDHSRNDFTGDVVFRQQALCSRRLPSVLEYVFSMFQHMHKTLLYISR